jgi:predicted amidohydrolase
MAAGPLSRPELEFAENVFDIFLLLFEGLKEREGEVLSLDVVGADAFDEARQRVYRECAQLADSDQEFRDQGRLSADAKDRFGESLLALQDEALLPACYGALLGIDQAFPPPARQLHRPLNARFRERGQVRFLPGANLPYEGRLIRGYAETGTRVENKLQNLTVSFPQRNGYTAEMVRLNDHLLAQFEDRSSPEFGIVPFRAQDDVPAIEVTHRIPDGGAFFTARVRDDEETEARLHAVIERAAQAGLDILVFPELSLTEQLLGQLRDRLATQTGDFPKLVVAGTLFDGRRNVCHVLGPDGRTLWQQPKMNRFQILPDELPDAPQPIPERGGEEDIDISERTIRIADLPFGRVAVLVCLDFILPETYSVLANMQVNCIIVPAMTPTTRRFETLAWAHAAASGATTIVCSAPNCPAFSSDARSFVYTPVRGHEPLPIADKKPWQAHMMVFSAQPLHSETVRISP